MGENYASLIVGVAFEPGDDLGRTTSETLQEADIGPVKTGIVHAGKPFRIFEDERHPFPKFFGLGYEIETTGRWDVNYFNEHFKMTHELLTTAQVFIEPAKAALKELGQESLCDKVGVYVVVGNT